MNGPARRGEHSWMRLGEQLLAGARLAAQQHGRGAAGDQLHLLDDVAQGLAVADDGDAAGLAELRRQTLALLVDAPLVFEDALAVAHDQPVQAHGLADQVGRHLEEAHILVGAHVGEIGPGPVDREGADHPVAVADRHADERNILTVAPQAAIETFERRVMGDILDHHGHFGDDDLADHALRQRVEVAAGAGRIERGRHHRLGLAGGVEHRDHAVASCRGSCAAPGGCRTAPRAGCPARRESLKSRRFRRAPGRPGRWPVAGLQCGRGLQCTHAPIPDCSGAAEYPPLACATWRNDSEREGTQAMSFSVKTRQNVLQSGVLLEHRQKCRLSRQFACCQRYLCRRWFALWPGDCTLVFELSPGGPHANARQSADPALNPPASCWAPTMSPRRWRMACSPRAGPSCWPATPRCLCCAAAWRLTTRWNAARSPNWTACAAGPPPPAGRSVELLRDRRSCRTTGCRPTTCCVSGSAAACGRCPPAAARPPGRPAEAWPVRHRDRAGLQAGVNVHIAIETAPEVAGAIRGTGPTRDAPGRAEPIAGVGP